MKRLTSSILSFLLFVSIFTVPLAADAATPNLDLLFAACGESVFDGSEGTYDNASLKDVFNWDAAYESGMRIDTNDGVNYMKFFKTSDFTAGGNLVLSSDIAEATNAENCDFVVLSFLSYSELQDVRNEYEHIYTFYGASSNTAGKEILKFKYRVGSVMPCTAENQDKDNFGGAILNTNGTPVRIFLLRDGGKLKYIYQVYNGTWKTAYEGSTDTARFEEGIGTIRAFVQFGGENVPAGFGDLKIYAGKYADVEEPKRYMEHLDRGLVAMNTDNGIYLSWRLLGTEEYDTSFEVYKNGSKIAEIADTTNYIDKTGTMEDDYTVAPVGGEESRAVKAFSSGENYFDIPLSQPPAVRLPDGSYAEYTPWDATAGDLDGDGEMEIIQRWDAPRIHAGQGGYTGGLVLDAYKLDGTVLWRIDLGVNIRCNTENVFSVYDYNGDGIAELAAKTAPGSIDGTGRFVSEASLISDIRNTDNKKDYRNSNGAVLDGPEYYTIFDGRNGKALDTIYYPIPRGSGKEFKVWGDDYGHRSEKYFDVPAYLDGVHPYIVLWRGIYPGQSKVGTGRTGVAALRVDENNRLKTEYNFDTLSGKPGYSSGNEKYIGQGNHNIAVGDVDFDGLDEIITGGLCLDNDLTPLWTSGRGHGDALHLANYDPTTDGLEFMTVHEEAPYGMSVYNAATGETLGHWDGSGDTGRGVMANVGAGGCYQIWGAGVYQSNGGKNFSETNLSGQSYNFRIFWDGDTYDELLDATTSGDDNTPYISSYNKETGRMEEIFRAWDSETINTTKSTPALTADILGDWREELIAVREDYKALRVFVSPIYTENKVYTLLHDSQYRQSVAVEHQFYNQPPHIGFYLSGDNDEFDERTKKPNITAVKYDPSPFEAAAKVESGVLEEIKTQDEKNVIDIDGDYFHAYEILSWQGGRRKLGNTTLSVSSGRYAFAAAANLRHSSVRNSWGITSYDGKFLVLAANNDANTTYTISGESAVLSGKLHYDFSMPKTYSNYNGLLRERGGDDAYLRIGNDISLFYDRDTTTLSLNGEVIHTYSGLDDAQKWTALDADIDALEGNINLKLTFPDGTQFERNCPVSKKPVNDISFTTYNWGCVLLDNVTLSSEDEDLWTSNPGGSFIPHNFESVSGKFTAQFDLIPYEIADGVIGLAKDDTVSWYSGLNIGVQLGGDSLLKARNGGAFAANETIRYLAGKKYHVVIEGDISLKRYSAFVTDESGKTYTLAKDYSFRSDAPDTDSLGSLYALGGDGVGGKFSILNFSAKNVSSDEEDDIRIVGNDLIVKTDGSMVVYAAQLDQNNNIICVNRKAVSGKSEVSFALEESTKSITVYFWSDTLRPLASPVTLKK